MTAVQPDPRSDKDLLRRFANGDREAFSLFYQRYRKRLYGFIRVQVGHREDADEVFQSVFITLFRQLKRFAGANNPEGYLFQCARNHCIDFLRRRQRSAEKAVLDVDRFPTEWTTSQSPTDDDMESFQACLRSLPAEQRQVLAMRFVQGMTFRDIASALQLSPKTVEARYKYGIEKIRRRMQHES